MNIFNFSNEFPDEESCRLHFKSERDKIGVTCKKCGSTSHSWLGSIWSYQCKACKSRTSLRSGTIMEHSNLPFLVWYKTILLLTTTKKGMSAKEIQRQLEMKRYEPVWAMVHKLRKAMGKRDARYDLEDMVEMDEGYFTVEASHNQHSKTKAGRGSTTKATVNVMAESFPLEDPETGEKSSACGYFKAKIIEDHTKESTNAVFHNSIERDDTILFTDKSTSYVDLADFVEIHVSQKSSNTTTKETLKWVHIAISNAKRNFVGTYHKIKAKYLQQYLNEFIYKLNRRYFGNRIFDRLIIAAISVNE